MKMVHSLHNKNFEISAEIRKNNWTKPYMLHKYMLKTLTPLLLFTYFLQYTKPDSKLL